MITVYFWQLNIPKSVSHAALRIGVGQSSGLDTYVSWWPGPSDAKITDPTTWVTDPMVPHSLKKDLEDEGSPTGTVSISGLDEQAMRREWQNILKNGPRYNAARKNCAWTVKYLLDIGTGYPMSAKLADFANLRMFGGIWTPRNTYEYALYVKKNYDSRLKKFKNADNADPRLRTA